MGTQVHVWHTRSLKKLFLHSWCFASPVMLLPRLCICFTVFILWDVARGYGGSGNKLHPSTFSKRIQRFAAGVISAGVLGTNVGAAHAFGPIDLNLKINSYKNVELCDGKKPIMPGQKAMEGLYPACIEVEATVNNPKESALKDVSVYGMVKENDAGNSVLPNNPDFSTDAGQYAMIKRVEPGEQDIKFQFVAATTKNPLKGETIPELTFFRQKAVSMPGGNKFEPLDECEIDPRADGCEDNDRDNRGRENPRR